MNGISMDNPMALLMNASVDSASNLSLGNSALSTDDTAVPGQTDLLAFVNMLDVSQGPSSAFGEDADQLVQDLVKDDFDSKKLADSTKPSSDDLLATMSQQANVGFVINPNDIKIKSDSIVGHPIKLDETLSNKSKLTSGETMLLGDLKNSGNDPKIDMLLKNSNLNSNLNNTSKAEKVDLKDVSAWSQAFSQGDLESIELVPEKTQNDFANVATTPKSAKSQNVDVKSNEVFLTSEPLLATAVKEKSPVAQTRSELPVVNTQPNEIPLQNKGFERLMPAKAEPTLTLVTKSDGFEKTKVDKSEKQDRAVDAADLILNRQVLMDSMSNRDTSASTLKSPSTIGNPSDMRLSGDSVKLLADKIDTMKENGSATLRVVVNPNEMGKIEIRVQKVNGEIRVQLSSDSKEVVRALADSHAELASRFSGRSQITSVEIGGEIQKSVSDSVRGLSLKAAMPSSDVLKIGQSQESKLNLASSDFSSDFSGFRNPEHREQQGREDARDRGMKKWQGVFEDRESA